MTMNPMSALTGATCDRLLDDPLLDRFTLAIMAEAAAIGERIGCPIHQSGEDRNAVTRKLGAFKTSMLQDVEAGKPLEIDGLLTAVSEIGRRVERAHAQHRRAARPHPGLRGRPGALLAVAEPPRAVPRRSRGQPAAAARAQGAAPRAGGGPGERGRARRSRGCGDPGGGAAAGRRRAPGRHRRRDAPQVLAHGLPHPAGRPRERGQAAPGDLPRPRGRRELHAARPAHRLAGRAAQRRSSWRRSGSSGRPPRAPPSSRSRRPACSTPRWAAPTSTGRSTRTSTASSRTPPPRTAPRSPISTRRAAGISSSTTSAWPISATRTCARRAARAARTPTRCWRCR